MKLIQLTDHVYYLKGRTNIGVIVDGNEVILVDSGLDSSIAKKLLKILTENSLKLKTIINTHSHADHCGGNAYLQEQTGAKVYAYKAEAALIEYPYLEPLAFFSGADPIRELKDKFLMAEASKINYLITEETKEISFNRISVEIIPLQGHSINQIGIALEGVLFCGDAVFSEKAINQHSLLYYVDIKKQKATLNFIKNSNYDLYVPSHGAVIDNIKKVTNLNLTNILDVEKDILSLLEPPQKTEELLKELLDYYQIEATKAQQYYLMKTLILAYLSSLATEERVIYSFEDNSLYWKLP